MVWGRAGAGQVPPRVQSLAELPWQHVVSVHCLCLNAGTAVFLNHLGGRVGNVMFA